jgi:hypothetical protein
MNRAAWQLHLENLALRQTIRALRKRVRADDHLIEYWRNRAMNGRPPGRATRKRRETG